MSWHQHRKCNFTYASNDEADAIALRWTINGKEKKNYIARRRWHNRFFKDHWYGVVILFVVITGGGWWLTQSLPGCLTDQKMQLAATTKAWTNNLTANEKFTYDLAALIARGVNSLELSLGFYPVRTEISLFHRFENTRSASASVSFEPMSYHVPGTLHV